MTCRYCSALNSKEDHRCVRCGRRLYLAPSSRSLPSRGQLAQAPALDDEAAPAVCSEPMVTKPGQGRLFGEQELPSEKVIPLRAVRPGSEPAARLPRSAGSRREALQRAGAAHPTPTPVRSAGAVPQQEFAFYYPEPAVVSPVDPNGIYCSAPVALPTHRMIAAVVDASMIILALGGFLLAAHLVGMELRWSQPYWTGYAVALSVLTLLYRLLWCFAEMDSVGMRAAGLKLINFDGALPDRKQRFLRVAAWLLSAGAGGLGLLWALADEEKLTWHDHISKTFPTPSPFLRRTPSRPF